MEQHNLKKYIQQELRGQHFDSCAVAVIDFANGYFISEDVNPKQQILYYDLASLTKPLTLAATYLKSPKLFNEQLLLLLNHRAGLPKGGRLSLDNWREQISSYSLKESVTLYSDFSALRLQLELEKLNSCSLVEMAHYYWDRELKFWKDVEPCNCVVTGERHGFPIQGVVHDDNAYNLSTFTAHAGLFATINGLASSLLNLNKQTNLLITMQQAMSISNHRFVLGWDRVEDIHTTLAGTRANQKTFGHLGFTGTSIWIDIIRQQGIVILTNATKNYWYDRQGLNRLRRNLADILWS